MRRVQIALGSLVVIGGAALAWGATRAHDEDPEYDDEREIAAHRRTRSDQIVIPEGFRIAKATKLAPVESHAVTMFVDGQSVRLGDRSFDLSESVGRSDCSVPMAFVHKLEWEERVAGVGDAGTQQFVNVVIDATTPFEDVLSAVRWVGCEGLGSSLVLATPSGSLGTVVLFEFRRFENFPLHIASTPSGYEVSRGLVPPVELDPGVRYGAGCVADAEGISVPIEADEDALTKCIEKAYRDEVGGHHYIDTIPSISLSASRKTPFQDVVHAIVSGEQIAPVGSWTLDP